MPRTVGETRTIPVDSAVWVDLVIRNKTHPDALMMNNTDPTIVQSHQQFMPCVFCNSRHIALLDGMVTCQKCHSVVDRIIDYGAEWRFFGTVSDGGGDVAELCMTLSRNHEFVRGKEAQHDSTFSISIEFVRMCDVTFVPESIYHKIPCVKAVPKSKVVHPQFAKLDIMNMLCDPFNSHWRLEYAYFVRAPLLAPSLHHDLREECDVSVMCTSAFIEDITALRAALTDLTHDTEWRAFRPLLGLLDGRSEVSLHGHIIAIEFDSHTRVVPSCGFMTLNDGRPDEVRLRVASFTQTLLNARALQIACEWEGYSIRSDAQQELCTRLLVARDNARNEAMQETTASTSPWSLLCPDNVFRDFYLDYVGQPQHPMRVHMGRTNERIANAPSDSAWFSFDPHHTHQRPHGKHVTANSNSNSNCNSNLRVGKRTFARVDGSLDVGGSIPACAASTK
eukprot:gene2749-12619_t